MAKPMGVFHRKGKQSRPARQPNCRRRPAAPRDEGEMHMASRSSNRLTMYLQSIPIAIKRLGPSELSHQLRSLHLV